MAPGHIYFLTLAILVAPSMWFNRMAALIAAVWAIGQSIYLVGADPASIDMVLDILAIGAGAAYARRAADFVIVSFFVPMAILNMASGMHTIHPYYAWWISFDMAMVQALIVPFGNDWAAVGSALQRLPFRQRARA